MPSDLPKATGTLSTRTGGTVRVHRGETLFAISRRKGVPIRALIDANDIDPPFHLRAGQTLAIPPMRVYVVARHDTVFAIARRFGLGVRTIIRQNDLPPPDYGVFVGQKLVLPWDGPGKPPAERTASEKSKPAPEHAAPPPPAVVANVPVIPAKIPPRGGDGFMWPVRGKVVSDFGAKGGGLFNDGINISAAAGSIVRAADNGVVAYAGNELRGYGNLLLIRHAGNWVSAYAHNGALLVRKGEVVHRGQPIARVGTSGGVTRPQLHFELRHGREAVDPRRYLSGSA